uniref:Coiled-coil domain containing 30 n=1 Tax=Callithrix jacchus TaxID=9483 RepID=A0A8I3W5J3_CALJA
MILLSCPSKVLGLQSHNEDLEKDKTSQNCLGRGMEQVAKKLGGAHEEIQRLTDQLQVKEKEQCKLGKLFQMTISDHVLTVLISSQA